jgi:iron complex outermembrane receptor protein
MKRSTSRVVLRAFTARVVMVAVGSLWLLQAAPASAQETDRLALENAGGSELNEVVVTARRVEERALDVPISMTVFSQQQLANANVVNTQDLAAITPSLSSENNFGSENTTFALRGFSQEFGTQPTVGVYFADVVAPRGAASEIPIGDGAGPGSFFDLQSVQVLKGPQGTLFGRNTTGGDILLVPQKPTGNQEGYAEVSYGNFDMRRIQAVENLPLGDNARFRIGVDRMDRNGYTNNDTGIGPDHFEGVNYLTVRASLVVDLSPNLENYQIFSYTHSNTDGTDQKLIGCDPTSFLGAGLACPALARNAGVGFYTVQNTLPDPYTHLTQWQFINTTTWHATEMFTFKNIASYAQLMEDQRNQLFGTDFNAADLGPVLSAAAGVPISFPSTRIDFAQTWALPGSALANESTVVDELQTQIQGKNNKWNAQGGVYFEESDPLATTGTQTPTLNNCAYPPDFICTDPTAGILNLGAINYIAQRTYFHNFGVYGQGSYSLTSQLKVTGGIRYTRDSETSGAQLENFHFPTPNVPVPTCSIPGTEGSNCNVAYRQSGNAPTWLIDLEYKPFEDLLSYIKWTRGYRAGGTNISAPTGFNTFQPESVNTYEAGVKTAFHGNSLISGTFDASIFYNDFTNQQLQLALTATEAGVTPGEAIFNAGKSRIYGAEADGSLTLLTAMTIDASWTYLDTKIKSIAPIITPAGSPYIVSAPANAGDPLILAPKNKYNVSGTYTLPYWTNLGRISATVGFTHTDKQLANYVDRLFPTLPDIYSQRYIVATNLLNANLSWNKIAGSGFDASVFGTNLTDQQYYSWIAGNIQSTGFETAALAPPRMYGARLRYSW